MERHINPFSEVEQSSDYEQRERERRIELKIAQAFLKQKYPLSEKGKDLRQEIERIVKTLEQNPQNEKIWDELHEVRPSLPTVENPQLELFEDLMVSPEDEEKIFGNNLAIVQVTKGCRHKCLHCTADASGKVRVMPFPALLKIAQKIKEQEGKQAIIKKEYEDSLRDLAENEKVKEGLKKLQKLWHEKGWLKEKVLSDPLAFLKSYAWTMISGMDTPTLTEEEKREVEEIFNNYLAVEFERNDNYRRAEDFFGFHKVYGLNIKVVSISQNNNRLHYADSDPFDYRDSNFLHDDGSVADYGDVVKAFLETEKRIHITTAGWPVSDKVALRAAKKVASFANQGLLGGIRISVHPYETGTSHQDPAKYRVDMENVMEVFKDSKVEYLFYKEPLRPEHDEFLTQAIYPLLERAKQDKKDNNGIVLNQNEKLSRFSGRIVEKTKTEDVDVMDCFPGIQIWPDGSVNRKLSGKGERPKSVGKYIFNL